MKWKWWNSVALALSLAVMVAIYASLWQAPALTWDDGSNIFNNPYYTMHLWWGVWLEPYFGLYVPITSSVWAFLYWLGGGQTWPFHGLNMALHAVNMVMVYCLLQGLARRWNLQSPIAACCALAIFALHPLQVETVAWISGGRDLLATFFGLFSVIVYFRWPGRIGFLVASAVFVLALLSKPSLVILPVAIYLMERKSARRMALWVFLSAGAIALTQLAQVEHFVNKVSWWQRPVVVIETYAFYIQKIFWPFPLSGNYARTPESVVDAPHAIWHAGLILGAFALLAFWLKTKPQARRLILLWLTLFLPVSGIVPFGYENISGVADHYNYLPMVGVAALFMLALDFLWHGRWRWAAIWVPAILATSWSWASWERTPVWRSGDNFFTDMARAAPDSYSTAIGMSVVMCLERKDFTGGLQWVDKALAAQPDDILALANRAYCLLHANRRHEVVEMASVLPRLQLEHLAKDQPTAMSSLLASLGTALIQEEKFKEGFQHLCEAYRIQPTEPNHAANLTLASKILREKGIEPACAELGK